MIRILKKLFSTTNCGHAVLGVVFILLMFTKSVVIDINNILYMVVTKV